MKRAVPLALALTACATLGTPGEGDRDLPSAGVGPFRKLAAEEVRGLAPFVLEDSEALYRDPGVLGDDATKSTLLYAVSRDAIVRTRATDQRSFYGTAFGTKPPVVLSADQAWEGALSGPSPFRRNGEILLYYAGAGGIGVARSSDGLAFRKEPGPILAQTATTGSWETAPPRAPTVYELPDGRLRMFYAAGAAIGEAESRDGVTWHRLPGPVLGPAPMIAASELLPNERPPFDTASVGDPCATVRITPAGRLHVRVLYTGRDPAGASAIGLAARYGSDGPLDRQPVPAYSVGLSEAAPAFVQVGDRAFLYVEQLRRDTTTNTTFLAIAAAVAPDPPLGAPEDVPSTP